VDDRVLAGRYQLLASLGSGGMARVWTALDTRLGRQVAIKLLDLDAADSSAGARFRQEAQVTAGLAHPNIVSVYDTGVDQKTAFLVMELLRGPTLDARLASDGPLPIEEVLQVGGQVAAALSAAHDAGVIHRDLKPSNVAYASDGQVKVLDFGIARLIESTTDRTRLTQTNTVVGTAAYLSPEQASGASADSRSDLYALGCLLFALAAGEPPFGGESALAICAQHVNAPPPSLVQRRADAPAGLVALVADLLRKNPTRRPPNAAVVRDRLDELQAGPSWSTAAPTRPLTSGPTPTEVLTHPSDVVARARTWPRGRLAAVGAGIAVLVAIVLLIALSARSSPHHSSAAIRPPATTVPVSSTTVASAPTSPVQAVTDFSVAVSRAAGAGDIAPPAAQDLLNRMTDLLTTVQGGHTSDAAHKVADLVHHLGDLAKSGQLTVAGQQVLAGPLAALERAIPPQSGPGGPGPP
jgi:serine/threonine-protein kinase